MKRQKATPEARAEFQYISRRLFILEQHPCNGKHAQEIHMLEIARHEILKEWPHICSEFRQEQLVGTWSEC